MKTGKNNFSTKYFDLLIVMFKEDGFKVTSKQTEEGYRYWILESDSQVIDIYEKGTYTINDYV